MRFPEDQIVAKHIDKMPEQERNAVRRQGIGASLMASVMGLHPRMDQSVPFLFIVYGQTLKKTQAMDLGLELEEPAARLFHKRTGLPVERANIILKHPVHNWMRCTPDRITRVDGRPAVLELKTSGTKELWGQEHEPVEGATPLHYQIQVQQQMLVLGWDVGFIGVIAGGVGGHEFRWWRIDRDPEWSESIITAGEKFWRWCTSKPPQWPKMGGSAQTAALLAELYQRTKPDVLVLPDEEHDQTAAQYLREREQMRTAETESRMAANQLKAWLGEHEHGETHRHLISWVPDKNGRRNLRIKPKAVFNAD